MKRLFAPATLALLVSLSSAQTEFWVDPAQGSDAALGTTPGTPFRTITYAVLHTTPNDTVHLHPGTYDASSGEAFPLAIPTGVTVQSIEGRSATIIDAGTSNGVLNPQRRATIRGATLRSNATRLLFGSDNPTGYERPFIEDCDLIGCEYAIDGSGFIVKSSRFAGQSRAAANLFDGDLDLIDCEIDGTGMFWGITGSYQYYDSVTANLKIERCSITGCIGAGIRFINGPSPSNVNMTISDSLIASNGRSGIWFAGAQNGSVVQLSMDGCTVANNSRLGLDLDDFPMAEIRSCIIAENQAEDLAGSMSVDWSLVSDGSHGGGVGNITASPRFVDSANGDWSLRFDSPCLDRGQPDVYGIDIAGQSRAIDSDLDLFARADMGAFEHAPLIGPEVATVGQPFELGVTGPVGGFSTIVVAPAGFAPFGANTIYGRLFLAPQGSFRVLPAATTGAGPTMVDMTSVLDPAWVGTTVGFQALPRSFAAPAGGAFSNPVSVRIE